MRKRIKLRRIIAVLVTGIVFLWLSGCVEEYQLSENPQRSPNAPHQDNLPNPPPLALSIEMNGGKKNADQTEGLAPSAAEIDLDIEDQWGPNNPRPKYNPNEPIIYLAQSGDTLPALAARFNTDIAQIRALNPEIPSSATTLPQGMPMKIPIRYLSNWGSSFQIIPDSLFVYSPEQSGFNPRSFTDRQPGWFKYFTLYAGEKNRRGGEIVEYVCANYSINPKLALALLDYLAGALSVEKTPDESHLNDIFGLENKKNEQLSAQLNYLANFLNSVYYEYREGKIVEFVLNDGSYYRIDPWQNAATVALQVYFGKTLPREKFEEAIGPNGFVKTYKRLFGDFPNPRVYPANIPGSLYQPELQLPFGQDQFEKIDEGKTQLTQKEIAENSGDRKYWAYTGGPHAAWGNQAPYAAIDFAPPSVESGCVYSPEWVVAPADGIITRKDIGIAVLDLDMDGDETTGWTIFFLHLLTKDIPPVGTILSKGDPISHPSCDGGRSSGTHVHLARKYNGEWIPAAGVIPFTLSGWIVENGSAPYEGYMRRFSSSVKACACSDRASQITNGLPIMPTKTPTPKPKK